MRLVARSILVSILLIGCVACDQATKEVARACLVPGVPHSYLHDTLRLVLVRNPGAFLSLGESLPSAVRSAVFIVGVGILSVGSLLVAAFARHLNRWQIVAFALIASGGCGNLADRLAQDGGVTDFLNVGVGRLRTGIFNVADMVLMAGLVLVLFVGMPGKGASDGA